MGNLISVILMIVLLAVANDIIKYQKMIDKKINIISLANGIKYVQQTDADNKFVVEVEQK